MIPVRSVFLFLSTCLLSYSTDNIMSGKPHNVVKSLDGTNFDEAINDPANGLWFIKFYGKLREIDFWCRGHVACFVN